MNKKLKIMLSVTFSFLILCECNMAKSSGEKYFKIEEAFYQSWLKNENDKGTTVTIILSSIKNNIQFDSIVFRGQQITVSAENKENTTILSATIYSGIHKLNINSKPVNKPDQLIFRVNGETHIYILKNIRREKMKYY